jgi:hypothetical protein
MVPLAGTAVGSTGCVAAWATSAMNTKLSAVADDSRVQRYCRHELFVIRSPDLKVHVLHRGMKDAE